MVTAAKPADIPKIDAVRMALEELGKKAMPGTIQAYVKEKFGLDMSMSHVSNCKTELRKKKRKKKVAEAAPTTAVAPVKAAPAPVKAAPAPVKAARASDASVDLTDIAAVKELVGRVGEDQLKSLIGLLG